MEWNGMVLNGWNCMEAKAKYLPLCKIQLKINLKQQFIEKKKKMDAIIKNQNYN